IEGNTLGFAGGQPTFVTDLDLESGSDNVEDANYAFELWYKFQVTDNISVTPAIFYFTRPLGDLTGSEEDEFTNFGGLVKTTFKF
ncbi:MAG: carbohydrate porin, partial [Prochlorococcus sp.]